MFQYLTFSLDWRWYKEIAFIGVELDIHDHSLWGINLGVRIVVTISRSNEQSGQLRVLARCSINIWLDLHLSLVRFDEDKRSLCIIIHICRASDHQSRCRTLVRATALVCISGNRELTTLVADPPHIVLQIIALQPLLLLSHVKGAMLHHPPYTGHSYKADPRHMAIMKYRRSVHQYTNGTYWSSQVPNFASATLQRPSRTMQYRPRSRPTSPSRIWKAPHASIWHLPHAITPTTIFISMKYKARWDGLSHVYLYLVSAWQNDHKLRMRKNSAHSSLKCTPLSYSYDSLTPSELVCLDVSGCNAWSF